MDIQKLGLVNDIYHVIQRCEKQLALLQSVKDTYASGERDAVKGGYYLSISQHSDGSGSRVDLGGCCVAEETVAAIEMILVRKIDTLSKELMKLGVGGLVCEDTPLVSQSFLTKDQIRDVFMENGFTIKDGLTDLKPYVYEAADALIMKAYTVIKDAFLYSMNDERKSDE
jgi:hypothetical protein